MTKSNLLVFLLPLFAFTGCEDVQPIKDSLAAEAKKNAELQARVEEVTADKNAILKQRDEAKTSLAEAQQKIETLAQAESDSKKAFEEYKATAEKQQEKDSADLSAANQMIESLEKKIADEAKAIATLKQTLADHKTELASNEKRMAEEAKVAATLKSNLGDTTKKLEDSVSLVAKLRKQQEDTTVSLRQSSEENRVLVAAKSELEKSNSSLESMLEKRQADLEKQKRLLADLEKLQGQTIAKLRVSDEESTVLTAKVAELTKQLAALRDQTDNAMVKLNSNLNVSEQAGKQWLDTIKRLQADRLEKRKEIAAHDELIAETIGEVTQEVIQSINQRIKIKESLAKQPESTVTQIRESLLESEENIRRIKQLLEDLNKPSGVAEAKAQQE